MSNSDIIAEKLRQLKQASGTHSPSIFTIKERIPEISIDIDACFLSNPYATDLFLSVVDDKLIGSKAFRDVLEYYPSQNPILASLLSEHLHIPPQKIFVGNGAIEVIQAVLHAFVKGKIIVNIPTFSSYYEFVKNSEDVIYYQLPKEHGYKLQPEEYVAFVKQHSPHTIVLINPNNPDGRYLSLKEMNYIISEVDEYVEQIIIDESFIHFAYENESFESIPSAVHMVFENPKLVFVKSMSKDFGIAGVRAGYGVMSEEKVSQLLENGYLWNSNGLAEFFFREYIKPEFQKKYEMCRRQFIKETQEFYAEFSQIDGLTVYPTLSNFVLVELHTMSSEDFFVQLLSRGVYVRRANDKIGLDGEFVRIASRGTQENSEIIRAVKEIL